MSHDIKTLRKHLFETLEDLRNPDKPMDLDRAMAVRDIGQTIINSAKVEVDFIRATGQGGSGFIPEALPDPKGEGKPPALPPGAGQDGKPLPNGIVGIRRHALQG